MGYHLQTPQLMISTRSAHVGRLTTLLQASQDAGLLLMELDIERRFIGLHPRQILHHAQSSRTDVASVWLPARSRFGGPLSERDRKILIDSAVDAAAPLVVRLPRNEIGRVTLTTVTNLTEPIQQLVPPTTRVTVAVPTAWLVGGRPHLVQLTALRRICEEWDIDIALDLTGPIDPQWEAEAAVLRIGSRLRIVRIAALPVTANTTDSQARLTARALIPALESGSLASVSLSPPIKLLQSARESVLVKTITTLADGVVSRSRRVISPAFFDQYSEPRAKREV